MVRRPFSSDRSSWLLAASLATVGAAFAVHYFLIDGPVLAEYPPEWRGSHVVATAFTATSAILLVCWLVLASRSRQGAKSRDEGDDALLIGSTLKRTLLGIIAAVVIALTLLFEASPLAFNRLCQEDGLVENLSAGFAFAASFAIFGSMYLAWRRAPGHPPLFLVGTFMAGTVFALVGLEEVSWFQRSLSVDTPALFGGNMQRETNLHNFATDEVENAYYSTAFLCLVLIPALHYHAGFPDRSGPLTPLVPGRYVMLASAPMTAFNYDMWNVPLTQYAFFFSIALLMGLAWQARRHRADGAVVCAILVVLVVAQLVFLAHGHRFVRLWDVTEYKELFIPLGFLVYSTELLHRVRSQTAQGVRWIVPSHRIRVGDPGRTTRRPRGA